MSQAIIALLTAHADDLLIIGHRNSEWTGMGPLLEEDIAFASMAQDKLGHALTIYELMHELGAAEPDVMAFARKPAEFRSCHLVEQPIGEYDFSLVRHLLYDYAYALRLQAFQASSFQPLAHLSQRLSREVKYHTLHAKTWFVQLGNGSEESKLRMQAALNEALPMAYGMFEPTVGSEELVATGVQPAEAQLQAEWLGQITELVAQTGLQMPNPSQEEIAEYMGGRNGYHTAHLAPMLEEMTEVFAIDPQAAW